MKRKKPTFDDCPYCESLNVSQDANKKRKKDEEESDWKLICITSNTHEVYRDEDDHIYMRLRIEVNRVDDEFDREVNIIAVILIDRKVKFRFAMDLIYPNIYIRGDQQQQSYIHIFDSPYYRYLNYLYGHLEEEFDAEDHAICAAKYWFFQNLMYAYRRKDVSKVHRNVISNIGPYLYKLIEKLKYDYPYLEKDPHYKYYNISYREIDNDSYILL